MGNGVRLLKRFFLGLLPVLAGVATAATFNLFSPATGILKGNASTYVTTAATSSDVIATFTGTCNNRTYLRGDGTCNTPPGSGVSSVGLTMTSGFSVTGSPVTSSGTLAVSTTLNGVIHGNGSGFTASNVNLASEVTGTLPVGNGGTGATTLTGLLKGNGTSAFTAATSADVIGLWTGTCNSGSFLRGDGACAAAGAGTVTSVAAGTGILASPSPITGSGTISIDTTVVPRKAVGNTFSAQQTFSTTGISIAVDTTNASGQVMRLSAPTASGYITFLENMGGPDRGYLGYGSSVIAGTAATDFNLAPATGGDLRFGTAAGAAVAVTISGSTGVLDAVNGLTVNGVNVCQSNGTNCPTAATSATATYTAVGMTTSPTATIRWTKIGTIAVMSIDAGLTGTSNSTLFTATGTIPAGFEHVRPQT